jgi:hypothetical protein
MKSALKTSPKPKVLEDDGDPERSMTPKSMTVVPTSTTKIPEVRHQTTIRLTEEINETESESESSMDSKEEELQRKWLELYEMKAYDKASEMFHVTFNHIIRLFKIE